MRKFFLASILSLVVLPAPAHPQVSFQMEINLGLPPAPPFVMVQPGIQVVENWPEEVFFAGGYYWARREDHWYRATNPYLTFIYVEPSFVPPELVRIPPGKYKHYRKEYEKAQKEAWKEHEKAEKKAWKEHEKAEKKHHKHDKHDKHDKHHKHEDHD